MPQTFMNDSGRSIRAALDWYGLAPGQLLLLVDDMDLPLGRLRLRASGGAGGHNGLRSTIAHLGGQEFARLRIGIGAPSANPVERKERTIAHVLGRFQASEQPILQEVLEEVCAGHWPDSAPRFGAGGQSAEQFCRPLGGQAGGGCCPSPGPSQGSSPPASPVLQPPVACPLESFAHHHRPAARAAPELQQQAAGRRGGRRWLPLDLPLGL
jgi:hypothetical protein